MIKIEQVSKSYFVNERVISALQDVSLHVKAGSIHGVIGYSGAGKSTLLRLVNGLEKPDKGEIEVQGKLLTQLPENELNALRKNIGMVFQQFNLLESQTVFQNIALPLILTKVSKKDQEDRVNTLLDFVDLREKANVKVSQLSGGQKQRIGIARALATNPEILLCDEATSALDPHTTDAILDLLVKVNEQFRVTILLITHEMDVIRKICDQVTIMEAGKIVEQGDTLEIFKNPQQEITKRFVETVVSNRVPRIISEQLLPTDTVAKLIFVGRHAGDGILHSLALVFNIKISILAASISELRNDLLGIFIVKIEGEYFNFSAIEECLLEQNVSIERLGEF